MNKKFMMLTMMMFASWQIIGSGGPILAKRQLAEQPNNPNQVKTGAGAGPNSAWRTSNVSSRQHKPTDLLEQDIQDTNPRGRQSNERSNIKDLRADQLELDMSINQSTYDKAAQQPTTPANHQAKAIELLNSPTDTTSQVKQKIDAENKQKVANYLKTVSSAELFSMLFSRDIPKKDSSSAPISRPRVWSAILSHAADNTGISWMQRKLTGTRQGEQLQTAVQEMTTESTAAVENVLNDLNQTSQQKQSRIQSIIKSVTEFFSNLVARISSSNKSGASTKDSEIDMIATNPMHEDAVKVDSPVVAVPAAVPVIPNGESKYGSSYIPGYLGDNGSQAYGGIAHQRRDTSDSGAWSNNTNGSSELLPDYTQFSQTGHRTARASSTPTDLNGLGETSLLDNNQL